MTPGARVAAAVDILDRIAAGSPAEKALTNWARASRFAGSKDRAAVRDHVYDALRQWRSSAWRGGAETGRARMIGLLRGQGEPLDDLFSGDGHAPSALSAEEASFIAEEMPPVVGADMPDWLFPIMSDALGAEAQQVFGVLQHRAPIFLRARDAGAAMALEAEGIITRPVQGVETGLEVMTNIRQVQSSTAYKNGLVELQDAGAQALCATLPVQEGDRVLDYCAGGGGKILALAARARIHGFAHDAAPERMRDLPARARRAGVNVTVLADPARKAPYDLVLCDVPCSGSGTWRRTPDAKWRLTPERLQSLGRTQLEILSDAATLSAPGGTLAYATCSVLPRENQAIIAAFQRNAPEWQVVHESQSLPGPHGDGFYLCMMRKS